MINFNTDRFTANHGKAPKGSGCWMFQLKDTEWIETVNGSFSDAKKIAKKRFSVPCGEIIVLP